MTDNKVQRGKNSEVEGVNKESRGDEVWCGGLLYDGVKS